MSYSVNAEHDWPTIGCSYDERSKQVNCTSRGLTEVPKSFPWDVKYISLMNNLISGVGPYAFWGCHTLLKLNLTRNNISIIDQTAFYGLVNLQELQLKDNSLCLPSSSVLPDGAFDHLKNLKTLDISHNKGVVGEFSEGLFENLGNLTELSLDLPGSADLGPGFAKLVSLDILTLTNPNDGLCPDVLKNDTFAAFVDSIVTTLQIIGHALKDIQPLAFAPFHHLKYLKLRDMPNLSEGNLSKAWFGLRYTRIQVLEISEWLNMTQVPVVLNEGFFSLLGETNISVFHFENNNIGFISNGLTKYLPHLTSLVFKNHNTFAAAGFFEYLYTLRKLESLCISQLVDYAPSITSKVPTNHLSDEQYYEPTYYQASLKTNRPLAST